MDVEPKTKAKAWKEKDTYNFGLQDINFSLDCLLLLVVRGLVRPARTVFDERDC